MRLPFALGFLAGGGFQLAFAHSVGGALDQGDVSMVGQAVEERGDAGGVGEDGVPILEGFIGRQEDGITLVTVVDDFKEQVGGVGVISKVATFVNDQQGGAGVEAELAAAQAGGIALQIGEQIGGGAEENGVAGEHGGMGDIFGNHGLAQPI